MIEALVARAASLSRFGCLQCATLEAQGANPAAQGFGWLVEISRLVF